TNAMRDHALQGTTTPLKAPATNSLPLLRIALSNGSTSDETVIAQHANASANFDQYDSEKMSNTGTSEVFTLAGTQELTINAQPDSEGSKLIPLGIRPDSAGNFSISASEFRNLNNLQVILHDNVLKTETQLSLNESYNFVSDGTATNSRFSIEFRAPGMTTDIDNSESEKFNITVYSGKIQIQSPTMANGELISIYSSNGQKIIEQPVEGYSTIINHKLNNGVYFVKAGNCIQKIIVQ
ncbi:MAG: T9SS type A sorting domain-containing protein, partial [Paludibacter sp.]|nr:T9SS type A sorting domain-containing protein [Paludibacter sp.]